MHQSYSDRRRLAMLCVLAALQHPHGSGVPCQLSLQEWREIKPKDEVIKILVFHLNGKVATFTPSAVDEMGPELEFQAAVNFRLNGDSQMWMPYYISLTVGTHHVVVGDCEIINQSGNCNTAIVVRT